MEQPIILLVEDDQNDEELVRRTMRKRGLENCITVAHNGREALDFLFETDTPPHLILLDLKMPKMGGLEVLQALRVDNRTRLIPVVVFTSSIEVNDVMTSYDLGANSYVRKPVDFDEFSEVMNKVLDYWLDINMPLPEKPRNG